eukprot:scaffold5799_cov110-Cylindrotheca_fusiformis.AAC.2
MTIVATEDNRNTEWRKNNVGLSLLEKMGYKDGEGIGKRNQNNVALRALKRKEGLGLGAKIENEGGNSESSNHFSAILANLQVHHSTEGSVKSKKKKRNLTLPQNKVTAGHASKMRQAKFGEKSSKDMACIFGNTNFPVLNLEETETKEKRKEKKRSRGDEKTLESDDEKRIRKEAKKRRKEAKKIRKEAKKKRDSDV